MLAEAFENLPQSSTNSSISRAPSQVDQPSHIEPAREALKTAPIASISPQEILHFADSIIQEVQPTTLEQLPLPQLQL